MYIFVQTSFSQGIGRYYVPIRHVLPHNRAYARGHRGANERSKRASPHAHRRTLFHHQDSPGGKIHLGCGPRPGLDFPGDDSFRAGRLMAGKRLLRRESLSHPERCASMRVLPRRSPCREPRAHTQIHCGIHHPRLDEKGDVERRFLTSLNGTSPSHERSAHEYLWERAAYFPVDTCIPPVLSSSMREIFSEAD